MNFNEFVNEVKDNIKLFLPKDYENAEVSTMECQQLMATCPPSEFCFSHTRERWELRGTPIKVKYGNQA